MTYKIEKTKIKDCLIIKPDVFKDERGYFSTPFVKEVLEEAIKITTGQSIEFVQDNESFSTQKVVRGIHFQQGEWAQSNVIAKNERLKISCFVCRWIDLINPGGTTLFQRQRIKICSQKTK